MAEIFLQNDAHSLLKNKKILLLGDSNVRALYKDLIWLLKCNSLIDANFLKRRLEKQFLGDELVHRSELTRGRSFTEHRVFQSGDLHIEFIFITRCYSEQIENLFGAIKNGKRETPDVIYMNSSLWDICRWGPNGVKEFQVNMRKLMKLLTDSLPTSTLFIWGTAVPTASSTSGGLIIKQLEFIQAALRVHVMEANRFTSSLVSSYGFDVLDLHYFMHYQVCRRSADGIHFLPHAMRFMTNLLLTHLALTWDVQLPKRIGVYPGPLEKILIAANQVKSENVEQAVKKMDTIASSIGNFQNAAGPSGAADKKKVNSRNKKKRRSLKRQLRSFGPNEPKTPPMYYKASQPTFNTQECSRSDLSVSRPGFLIAAPHRHFNQPDDPSFALDSYDDFQEGGYYSLNTAPGSLRQYIPPNTYAYYNIPMHTDAMQGSNAYNRHVVFSNVQQHSDQQLNSFYYDRHSAQAPGPWHYSQDVNGYGGRAMRISRDRASREVFPYYKPHNRKHWA